ncbi:MAG: copper oxidase [Acidobacteria bacterium]|nr:copper oxidase [Acidobacteriota bacterium]
MGGRRSFFTRVTSLGAGLWAGRQALAQQAGNPHAGHPQPAPAKPKRPSTPDHSAHATPGAEPVTRPGGNIPVEMPDLGKLPHKLVDGVKEFHLISEVVRTDFLPGREVDAWGFNGSVPGPTIEVNQGDKVRVIFENRLPEMTAVHWHGFEVPMEMDGSVGLGQDPVPPGGKFVYEFTLNQHGTFFYHSHFAMQEMMGMLGMFIIHPREPYQPRVDRDFGLILQEWALLANNTVPNTLSMEFNWLTFNGKAGPACTPMIVKQGERVRVRLVNIGMDHHPIHLHGNQFVVTGTEAGRIPQHLWYDQNTVLVGVAQARNFEFEAKYTGDWMLHCHLPHHMMNQMASMVGPVSHGGHGLHTGGGMTEGMGMLRKGDALAEENGPMLGRGIGLSGDLERATSNLVAQQQPGHEGHAGGPMEMYPKDDPAKKKVPGYPQDMWMPMDEIAGNKPENFGLRKGWSGAMMGMMTLIRVVPSEVYDKIMDLKAAESKAPKEKKQNAHQPHHHQQD